jgi:hypothetical protein
VRNWGEQKIVKRIEFLCYTVRRHPTAPVSRGGVALLCFALLSCIQLITGQFIRCRLVGLIPEG